MKFDFVTLKPKTIFAILFAISVGSLSMALVAEHIFKISPCSLCIYQRVPYLIIAFLSFLGCTTIYPKAVAMQLLQWLFIVFVAAVLLSGYHVSIEQGWLAPSSLCTNNVAPLDGLSHEEAWRTIAQTPLADCRYPSFYFIGVSIARWNLYLNVILGACLAWLIRREQGTSAITLIET